MISINWRLLRREAERRVTRLASEAGLASETNSMTEQVGGARGGRGGGGGGGGGGGDRP